MIKGLDRGRWERPTDKMAVYYEFEPGQRWGVRVTLYPRNALVEAVDGPKCVWYRAPKRLAAYVEPPGLLERLRGITFEEKLLREVEEKRRVAREESGRSRLFADGEDSGSES